MWRRKKNPRNAIFIIVAFVEWGLLVAFFTMMKSVRPMKILAFVRTKGALRDISVAAST